MEVRFAKVYGFCDGVENAVRVAESAGQGAYTLGPIVHNKHVVDELKEKGIRPKTAEELLKMRRVPGAASYVVGRAHGTPVETVDQLKARKYTFVDTMCRDINMQCRAALELEDRGYEIWLVDARQASGKMHPETLAKIARLKKPFKRITAVWEIPEVYEGKVALMPQTTLDTEVYQEIVGIIEERKGIELEFAGGICPATHQRQDAAAELAPTVDAMVIVGGGLEGQPSNNTMMLVEIARKHNKRNLAFLVSGPEEIGRYSWTNINTVGITGGASTPRDLVHKTAELLKKL